MKQLTTAPSRHPSIADIAVVQWRAGDPFPQLGPTVGVDTETELITDTILAPPLVVLGVYDDMAKTCYISYWGEDATAFMRELCARNVQQRYFNLGFDEMVLDDHDQEKPLFQAIDANRVRDMQMRIHLHALATIGYIPYNWYSLADCSHKFLGVALDKGDPDDLENSARLTFRRHNDDGSLYQITEEQAIYLAYDCYTTWALGEKVPEQPTETHHTKGMCVLANTSRNGLEVDRRIFSALTDKLIAEREEQRKALLAYGFPDPDSDETPLEAASKLFYEQLSAFCETAQIDSCCIFKQESEGGPRVFLLPTKNKLRRMLVYLYQFSDDVTELDALVNAVCSVYEGDKTGAPLRKAEQAVYDMLCEEHSLISFDEASKAHVMLVFVAKVLECFIIQARDGYLVTHGFDFNGAIEYASRYMDDHPELTNNAPPIGPRKFFQNHVQQLLENHTDLELERTPKSGEVKLTLKDMWRLEDKGVSDKFLTAYTSFNHCQKYLSTYLNAEYIKADGRVHARFVNIMRTGRTSCRAPNIQNLPSRDKVFPLKNMYKPYDGMVLCATDFSYLELCAFAEVCYQRFGQSVMMDVINAGLDPHRWFAGVMLKVIDPDLSKKDDKDWVAETSALLKEKVADSARQRAKAANFGFPGALGVKTFYRNCREQGVKITMEEAEELRNEWISTFTEMKRHMNPTRWAPAKDADKQFGFSTANDEELEEDETEEDTRDRYMCQLPCGQLRVNCSYNAACNTQFQGTAAIGAKLAGWNLVINGYGNRLCDFIHDEYLYCLYPEELKVHVPRIEQLMLAGMREVIPDVKLGVETTVMLHWDKKAAAFNDLQWNGATPMIEEPPYVKEVLTPTTATPSK